MRSDIIAIKELPADAAKALLETERAAAYNRLDPQQINTLRLLAEEEIAVTAEVLKDFNGQFWLENDGQGFELHLQAMANIGVDEKDSLVDLSTAQKNTYPRGIRGKLASAIDAFITAQGDAAAMPAGLRSGVVGGMIYDISAVPGSPTGGMISPMGSVVWAMSQEQQSAPEAEAKDEELEGIEKSIIERYADDVVVTVRVNRVEIVVKKAF